MGKRNARPRRKTREPSSAISARSIPKKCLGTIAAHRIPPFDLDRPMPLTAIAKKTSGASEERKTYSTPTPVRGFIEFFIWGDAPTDFPEAPIRSHHLKLPELHDDEVSRDRTDGHLTDIDTGCENEPLPKERGHHQALSSNVST